MKRITLIILFLLPVFISALSLNNQAQGLREKYPDVYEAIKAEAVEQWGENHQMIVYEINEQSKAILIVSDLLTDADYTGIVYNAIIDWCDGGRMEFEKYKDNLYEAPVNWKMVVYVSQNQINSMNEY